METLRAALVGLWIGVCIFAPTALFYRRQIIEGWKGVLGLGSGSNIARTPSVSASRIRQFRRSWPVTTFQIVVLLASASVAITGTVVAAVLSLLICLVTALSLGLNLLARTAEGTRPHTQ